MLLILVYTVLVKELRYLKFVTLPRGCLSARGLSLAAWGG